MTAGNTKTGFEYGPNRERIRRLEYPSAGATLATEVVHYAGSAEIRRFTDGRPTEVKRYVGPLLVVQTGSGANYRIDRRYVLTDAQGSTFAVLTDWGEPVNAHAAMGFDPFGLRREPVSGYAWLPGWLADVEAATRRGYTGHEHVDTLGLIHMNGRIYDAQLARFLQADPFLQDATHSQSLNPYTYVLNNPLAYTDPTGYWGRREQGYLRTAASIVIAVWTGYYAGGVAATNAWQAAVAFVGGYAAGAVQTGTGKGALQGGVSSVVFFGINYHYGTLAEGGSGLSTTTYAERALVSGVAGGVLSTVQGGRFGNGFVSAGLGSALNPAISQASDNTYVQGFAAAIVGGTVSEASGGKFGNGAVMAAFGLAFNELSHEYLRRNTQVVETLYSTQGETFAAFTTRAADRLLFHTEQTGFEYAIGLAERIDATYVDRRQYGGIIETQGSHIYSAVTQIPKGFSPIMSTSGSILRMHSHGRYRDDFDKPIPANRRDMDYMRLGSGSRIAPTVPVQNRFKFSDQDAATRGGLATPSGLIWWPGDGP